MTGPAEPALAAFLADRLNDACRVTLRQTASRDEEEFLGLVAASASLHHPWVSLPAGPREFRAFLSRFDHVTAESLLITPVIPAQPPGLSTSTASSAGASRTVPSAMPPLPLPPAAAT
jgi:hypothetical protein